MTSKTIFSFILAAAFVTTSCKKELEPQDSGMEERAIEDAVENTSTSDALTVNPQAPEVPNQPVQMTQPVQQTPQKVAPGMNPAHGQPGHRCEIPVGAPLNSAPAATQSTATQMVPTMTSGQIQNNAPAATPSILNPASSTAAKPGMNPEHGQPGHRCDIAVGQPLP